MVLAYSRRKILKITAIAAMSASLRGIANAGERKRRPILRPPGAVAEDLFMAKCNRCHRCVQICPTRVILPVELSTGILKANTPELVFKNGSCNSCMECTHVCLTRALVPTVKEAMKIGEAVIIKEDCVAWYWIGCTVCVDKCPLKAIALDEAKRPVVDALKCNGCGICEELCPSQSIRSELKGRGILVYPKEPS